jgi:branched-chain amino acid transport system ATP-binding protein
MTETVVAESASKTVLAVKDIAVRFGGLTALDAVSLELGGQEIVGVIGPNGAGKTTLFNVICGFVEPDAGEIIWQGSSLLGTPAHSLTSRGISRTLQGVGLFPGLTVLENVMVGVAPGRRAGLFSTLLGLPRADRAERELRTSALEALDRLGVADHAARLPDSLPYPTCKRVALARALACEPQLLMLDEPAAGLGADDMEELGELIAGLRGSTSVMLVEHHMDFVTRFCDRLVVLDFGRVIASGTPADVQADPAVQAAYLGVDVERSGEVGDSDA